jgi:hypothetical protein
MVCQGHPANESPGTIAETKMGTVQEPILDPCVARPHLTSRWGRQSSLGEYSALRRRIHYVASFARVCRVMHLKSPVSGCSRHPGAERSSGLVAASSAVSGERTKKAAVTRALEEFIARRKQKNLLELMGKLEWDNSYDHKAERSR